jgi:hypothetical protein
LADARRAEDVQERGRITLTKVKTGERGRSPSVWSINERNELNVVGGARRVSTLIDSISLAAPGFDFAPVIGIFGRSGMPRDVVQKIAAEPLATVSEPDLVRQLAGVSVEAAGGGPEDFAAVLQAETGRVSEAVRLAGIKAR